MVGVFDYCVEKGNMNFLKIRNFKIIIWGNDDSGSFNFVVNIV